MGKKLFFNLEEILQYKHLWTLLRFVLYAVWILVFSFLVFMMSNDLSLTAANSPNTWILTQQTALPPDFCLWKNWGIGYYEKEILIYQAHIKTITEFYFLFIVCYLPFKAIGDLLIKTAHPWLKDTLELLFVITVSEYMVWLTVYQQSLWQRLPIVLLMIISGTLYIWPIMAVRRIIAQLNLPLWLRYTFFIVSILPALWGIVYAISI